MKCICARATEEGPNSPAGSKQTWLLDPATMARSGEDPRHACSRIFDKKLARLWMEWESSLQYSIWGACSQLVFCPVIKKSTAVEFWLSPEKTRSLLDISSWWGEKYLICFSISLYFICIHLSHLYQSYFLSVVLEGLEGLIVAHHYCSWIKPDLFLLICLLFH